MSQEVTSTTTATIQAKSGSEWHQWDLHFHTPSSYDYKDKSVTDEFIIEELARQGIKAIAITDHHTIDVARIDNLKRLGHAKGIFVIPGIEFRTVAAGSDSIHFIGLFPPDEDLTHIWTTLQGKLGLTDKAIKEKGGDHSIAVDYNPAFELIHQLKGLITIHSGGKSNSVEGITNSLPENRATKTEIATKVDFYELGKLDDAEGYEKRVFPNIKRVIPMIICSDNHDIKNYSRKAKLWIKGEICFNTLRLAKIETSRIFRGEEPPIHQRRKFRSTKLIDSLSIKKKADSTLKEAWFDGLSLTFNHELVAIIGNKGNGKSALVDIIASLCHEANKDKFSFLKHGRFLSQNKASNFEAEINWLDGTKSKKNLDQFDSEQPTRDVYLPQHYLEKWCNEDDEAFENQLKTVIFSHIKEEDRLGKASLDELIGYHTAIEEQTISQKTHQLNATNQDISRLQEKKSVANVTNLTGNYNNLLTELRALHKNKPKETTPSVTETNQDPNNNITKLQSSVASLEVIAKAKEKEKAEKTKEIAALEQSGKRFDAIKSQVELFKKELAGDLSQFNINADEVFSFSFDRSPIEGALASSNDGLLEVSCQLDATQVPSIANSLAEARASLKLAVSKLDHEQQIVQQQHEQLKNWNVQRQKLIGAKEATGSLLYLRNEIRYCTSEINDELARLYEARILIVQDILRLKRDICACYELLYKPVTTFISTYAEELKKYPISFSVGLQVKKLEENFFHLVSQKSKGTFHGAEAGQIAFRDKVNQVNLADDEAILGFATDLIRSLEGQSTDDPFQALSRQLKSNATVVDLHDTVFNLDYLEPKYTLQFSGKQLSQLSPGEKGALLLIFFLLLDQNDSPLLIDQPEDNLDNQSVFSILVPFIKKAKARRQVFIVTHNPNLAVACDAEQIINVNLDKAQGYAFNCFTGGLENPKVNECILDVLEGTLPAFSLRDSKYGISGRDKRAAVSSLGL